MTTRTQLYIAAGVVAALIAFAISTAWSSHEIRRLEDNVATEKARANASLRVAEQLEAKAAEYRKKIDYLEALAGEIEQKGREQDEKLTDQNTKTNAARSNARRARDTRAIDSDSDELCKKLAELGHGC